MRTTPAEYWRKRRKTRRAAHVCIRCPEKLTPADAGHALCGECRRIMRMKFQVTHASGGNF